MNKTPGANNIEYKCSACPSREDGGPDDTLFDEGFVRGPSGKLTIFRENTPFDLAGNRVLIPCKKCGMSFVYKINIDESRATHYICSCGNGFSHADYVNGKY